MRRVFQDDCRTRDCCARNRHLHFGGANGGAGTSTTSTAKTKRNRKSANSTATDTTTRQHRQALPPQLPVPRVSLHGRQKRIPSRLTMRLTLTLVQQKRAERFG